MKKAHPFALPLLLLLGVAAAANYNPKADPKAVVTLGRARFTVLTDRLLRIEWAATGAGTGTWEDSATAVVLNRLLPVPKFSADVQATSVALTTDYLLLKYTPGDAGLSAFNATNLQIAVKATGAVWHPGDVDSGNLLGTIRTLDSKEGRQELDCKKNPSAESLHCTYGIISRGGWTVHNDSASRLLDDGDAQGMQWLRPRASLDASDLYFLGYGHDYRTALGDFTRISGPVPLPPRYAFGIYFSRWWGFNSVGNKHVVKEYELHHTPLDVFVSDMDWHVTFYKEAAEGAKDQAGQTLGWTGYTWDRHLYPNPESFFKWCKAKGLRNTLNLHPASGVQPFEELYADMARYVGQDPSLGRYVPFDINNKTYATGFMDVVLKPVTATGVDFWWLDWQQSNEGNPSPTWMLNHVFFNNEKRTGGNLRGIILHRWGGLGNHRYQLGFSGDVIPSWASLAFQPYFTMTAANVGYGYWSHDLGGHTAPVEPELYTRWLQWGAFSPIFRTHCTKNAENDRRIWTFPIKYFYAMQQAHQLRSQLVPYIYTEAWRTFNTGVSTLHPMYYDWPEAAEAYTETQYMFGEDILVAPIVTQGDATTELAETSIWLPEGKWIEMGSGAGFSGPTTIKRSYDLDEIPVFVRAGTVIPMLPEDKPLIGSAQMQYTSLLLNVFPYADEQGHTYTLYEDDGLTDGYQSGQSATTAITYTVVNSKSVTVTVAPAKGSFAGMPASRKYAVRLNGVLAPASVTVNGIAVSQDGTPQGWTYDGSALALTVQTDSIAVGAQTQVTVNFAQPLALYSSWTRCVARLEKAKELLDQQWGKNVYPEEYYDLQSGAVAGERVTAVPSSAAAEVAALPKAVADSAKTIAAYSVLDAGVQKRILALLNTCA